MEVVTLNRSCDKRFSKRLNIEVATVRRDSDTNTESEDVVTSFSGRDISCKVSWSRHHSVVATSALKNGGRNII